MIVHEKRFRPSGAGKRGEVPEKLTVVTRPNPRVARLTLNRPEKHNALSMALRREIEKALSDLAADPAVRVVILDGGEGVFCAGYDLPEVHKFGVEAFRHRYREWYDACYRFPKPMIAAVNGPALAGGFDLALAADFIIASHRASFGHPEIMFAPVAVAPLARLTSPGYLRRIALSAEILTADQGLEAGFLHSVVDEGCLNAKAEDLAALIASFAPAAVSATKRAVDQACGLEFCLEADAKEVARMQLSTLLLQDAGRKRR
ncbi:MAG: enoyl-CoA hydratase/isomerase family protein [Acidobacteriota bacterium]